MKKVFMLLTLAIGLQFSASAQLGVVCITNDRDCDIEVRLEGSVMPVAAML